MSIIFFSFCLSPFFYEWLCKRRKHYHYNDDVWHLRSYWDRFRPMIQEQLRSGTYRFSPVRLIRKPDGITWLWCAADALVLKATALALGKFLRPFLGANCFHLAGNGGAKGAVRAVQEHIEAASFVFRSDVKGYYEAIDHECLMEQLKQLIPDPLVLRLLHGYMQHLEDDGGFLRPVNRGISLGCPLSPLMSAIYLKPLDLAMVKNGLFYARFMDDWVVLSPSRWKLRKAIKAANQVLEQLKVEKHPDKTFIGWVDRGFDFLGYHFTSRAGQGLEVAKKTIDNHVARITRLYEQGADVVRIGVYIRHWLRWLNASVLVNPSFSYCSIYHVDPDACHDPPVTEHLGSSLPPSYRSSGFSNYKSLPLCAPLCFSSARPVPPAFPT
jgi:hypothetical protein